MITIGIPCYKQAKYLPYAIESALSQTVPCEVIVVNDGSPDATLEVAGKYPVKVINQVNKGLSAARNTAIMNMTGDYFLPLDADDILQPNCVEKLQEVIDKTGADVVAPSFKAFGVSNGEVILTAFTVEDLKTANRLPYFCAIKKEVLQAIGGYSTRMTWGWEDYHLWFDIMKRGYKICTLPEVLVLYRTKEQSMIHEANAHAQELWEQIYKDHAELFSQN